MLYSQHTSHSQIIPNNILSSSEMIKKESQFKPIISKIAMSSPFSKSNQSYFNKNSEILIYSDEKEESPRKETKEIPKRLRLYAADTHIIKSEINPMSRGLFGKYV